MAKAVLKGKISKKKFQESYDSFKNYISHGNCIKFGRELDVMVNEIFENYNPIKE